MRSFLKTRPAAGAAALCLVLLAAPSLSSSSAKGAGLGGPVSGGISQDAATLDAVMKTFYESLTFPEGKGPDWVRYKSLFASAAVPCNRTTPGNELATTLEGFLDNFSGRIRSGVINSFYEAEIARTTETYGRLALVFSAYEKGLNTTDRTKFVRGINSLQLVQRDGRWWIISIAWEDETPGNPLPAKYAR
jgi:hypothetical protein